MDAHPALAPFFFQMMVSPNRDNKQYKKINGCYATIIIFANSGEKARERVGKFLASENWEITEIKRVQLLNAEIIKTMDSVLRHIYTQAENFGIGSKFDTW